MTPTQYDLHRKHSKNWRSNFPACLKRADFHRGFPYPRRTLRASQFAAVTAADWNAAPVWNIRLAQHNRAAFAAVLECPKLRRIGRLTFSWTSRNRSLHLDDAIRLVRSNELSNLAELSFSFFRIGPVVVRALCESAALPALVDLSLYHCGIGAGGVGALAASPLAQRLESLNVNSNGLTANDLRPLFAALPRFTRLRHLGIGGNEQPSAVVRALVTSTLPPQLESLDIGGGELTDEAVALVANWAEATKLTRLDMRRHPGGYGATTVRALTESPYLTNIWRLTCPLAPENRDALAAALQERFGFHVSVT